MTAPVLRSRVALPSLPALLLLLDCSSVASRSDARPPIEAVDAGGAPAPPPSDPAPDASTTARALPDFGLGARIDRGRGIVTFRVWSDQATRIELSLFSTARNEDERLRALLHREGTTPFWSTEVSLETVHAAGITTIFYGYRTWGPNWPYDPAWTKGAIAGYLEDVDAFGNRFNPNKLLSDPYALELSHDPFSPVPFDGGIYEIGSNDRLRDSGKVAPKGIVIGDDAEDIGAVSPKPTRALKDDVIYEVHVRGFTANDPAVAPAERGTYLGAARKAQYLKDLGITAVEFLPVHETQNEQNDDDPGSANYWGYATLDFFAPDRRLSSDKSPGGPTREIREMVRAFHAEGIKVLLDVVYNHTGEGGSNHLLSWRGFGATAYYEPSDDPRYFVDNNGVGPNFHPRSAPATQLVLDSLAYASRYWGIDGFRFDLASVLGDSCQGPCVRFDKFDSNSVLNRAVTLLPARPASGGAGVDLVAEPWAIGLGTYQLGEFPPGWSEWNGAFRDVVRTAQNRAGAADVSPRALGTRLLGSADLYGDDGRTPSASINFVVAHDGFTLRDLFTYDVKVNDQASPFGPSNGGTDDNISWSHGGVVDEQKKAFRTANLLLALASGVPMMLGGDELYRTQRGNNNAYNLDNLATWLDWTALSAERASHAFVRGALRLRAEHAALRPDHHFGFADHDGNGLADVALLSVDGSAATSTDLDDAGRRFIALRFDGEEAGDVARSIYVAYNWNWTARTVTLPAPAAGRSWYMAADSNLGWTFASGSEPAALMTTLDVAPRSVVVLVER